MARARRAAIVVPSDATTASAHITVNDMRGFGLLIAMDAIDLALREQAQAARKRPAATPSVVGADGEPIDKLSDQNEANRMSAWRTWSQRRETAERPSSMSLIPRRTDVDGATTSG